MCRTLALLVLIACGSTVPLTRLQPAATPWCFSAVAQRVLRARACFETAEICEWALGRAQALSAAAGITALGPCEAQ